VCPVEVPLKCWEMASQHDSSILSTRLMRMHTKERCVFVELCGQKENKHPVNSGS
jgi:hypothetical protein